MHKVVIPKICFFLFYCFVCFLPHTKLSIPMFFAYEFTVADLLMMILTVVSLLFVRRISRKLSSYIFVFIFFLFTILCSFPNARSIKYFVAELLPYVFSLMIIITVLSFFTIARDRIKVLSHIFYVLLFTLLISCLPVYYQLFTGQKFAFFYDIYMWRYTFLCQNPNQFGVFVLLYTFLLILLTLKYFPKRFKYIALTLIFFVPTALYSGSRTVAVVFVLNLLLISVVFFLRSSWFIRLVIYPVVLIAIIVTSGQALETITKSTAQTGRVFAFFERMSEPDDGNHIVEGASGDSMVEAMLLFNQYPLTGVGLANKPMYSNSGTEIHNTFLKFLAETGLLGFCGFLLIFLIPVIMMLKSGSKWDFILIAMFFYMLFAAMNWPHMLFRQRWVWFFMVIYFLIAKINVKGKLVF